MAVKWNGAYSILQTARDPNEDLPENQQWYRRFRPNLPSEMIGNTDQRSAALDWFERASAGLLIIGGAVGTGKTRCVEVCAEVTKRRLISMDMDEGKSASIVEGFIRKAQSENAVLFLDDVNRLVSEGSTGLQQLLKSLKSTGASRSLRAVCCYDGSQLCNAKLSALIAAASLHLVFERVPSEVIMPYLQMTATKAKCRVDYFDALLISQRCNGDVRAALIRAEFLFCSRPHPVQRSRKTRVMNRSSRVLSDSSICVNGCLPDAEMSVDMLIRGKLDLRKTAESAAAEGVCFARNLNSKVHSKWLSFCDPSAPVEALSVIAEALCESDIMLHPSLMDLDSVDDLRNAELMEYGCRPVVTTMVLAAALDAGAQMAAMQKVSRRPKKMKFSTAAAASRLTTI